MDPCGGIKKAEVVFTVVWSLRRHNIPGVFNLLPMSILWPRMAMNAAQHKMVYLLQTFVFCSSDFVSVFNLWSKTALLSVWPGSAKRLDSPRPFTIN